MRLELSKKYIRRDGKTTALLVESDMDQYPFLDPRSEIGYTSGGKALTTEDTRFDLIELWDEKPRFKKSIISGPNEVVWG